MTSDMRYFLVCLATVPFLLMLALLLTIAAVVLAAAFITWDYSVIPVAFHAVVDAFNWSLFRFTYCAGLVAALVVHGITND